MPNNPGSGQTDGKSLFVAALVPAVVNQVVQVFSQGVGCAFGRCLAVLGARPNFACLTEQELQSWKQQQGITGPPYGVGQGGQPQGTPGRVSQSSPAAFQQVAIPVSAAAQLSLQPLLAFNIQETDGPAPHGKVLKTLASGVLHAGQNPSFQIKTNASFAMTFSTSVPGRIRLINTNSDNMRVESDLYEALPGSDNRMPQAHQGAIQMIGKPGAETLEVVFTPCISDIFRNHPRVAGFANSLPSCGAESATKGYVAQGGKRAADAMTGGRTMLFPANSDTRELLAVAPSDYKPGEVLRFTVNIDHISDF